MLKSRKFMKLSSDSCGTDFIFVDQTSYRLVIAMFSSSKSASNDRVRVMKFSWISLMYQRNELSKTGFTLLRNDQTSYFDGLICYRVRVDVSYDCGAAWFSRAEIQHSQKFGQPSSDFVLWSNDTLNAIAVTRLWFMTATDAFTVATSTFTVAPSFIRASF